MVTNQPTQAEITDFGSIKRLIAPPGWIKDDDEPSSLSSRQTKQFHPQEADDVFITAFWRGNPVDEESAEYFRRLLERPLNEGQSYSLSVDEIKGLSAIMGFSTVGDNQHTNDSPKGTNSFPVFNMKGATLEVLNGRTVMRVEGTFQTEGGMPTNEFEGYFFQNRLNKTEIEELFFQSATRGKFIKYESAFRKSLKTIEWH